MAGEQISPYLGNKIIRWMLNASALPSMPAALYMGLWDGNPYAGGTEVTTTVAAARVAVDFEAAPASGSDNAVSSDALTSFGNSLGNADVDYVALHDAASGGNILIARSITPLAITTGALVTIPSGDVDLSIGEV